MHAEMVKIKLLSGITGTAAYHSNFGFRTTSADGATHGLVPNDTIKAQMASDTSVLLSFLPEHVGSSYFMYFVNGWKAPGES